MHSQKHLSRKSFLLRTAGIAGGLLAAAFTDKVARIFSSKFLNAATPPQDKDRIIVVTTPVITRDAVDGMVKKAMAGFGGMGAFIKKGMKVVIKPNIAWNAPPESAACTNPYLVESVARVCKQAGAEVTIFDRTCNSARVTYKRSGMEEAADRAGVNLEFVDERKFKDVKVVNGLNLTEVAVYKPLLEADFVINMPIAKHHSTSELTIAMKNLMGVVGGNRGGLHWSMHENLVDLTKTIKTDLVICDCLRILTNHGPNSGGPEDVKETKTVIVGRNPVTVDAYATTLFGKSPASIKYLALAQKEGMGEINPAKMNITRMAV